MNNGNKDKDVLGKKIIRQLRATCSSMLEKFGDNIKDKYEKKLVRVMQILT